MKINVLLSSTALAVLFALGLVSSAQAQSCPASAVAVVQNSAGQAADQRETAPYTASTSLNNSAGSGRASADATRGILQAAAQNAATGSQFGVQAQAAAVDCFRIGGVAAGSTVRVSLRVRFSGTAGASSSVAFTASAAVTQMADVRSNATFDQVLTSQPFDVTAGTEFPVILAVVIVSTDTTSSTGNATYEFVLPAGATISSTAGFGGSTSTGPVLSLGRTSLLFSGLAGATLPAQSLAVTNAGTGTLNWTAAVTPITGGNWLSLNQSSGTAPATLSLSARTTGLDAGVYAAQITVTAAGATGSPAVVYATMVLAAPQPSFAVAPDVINLSAAAGSAATTQVLQVSATGTVSFTAAASLSNGTNWLAVTPASGTATPAAPATVAVRLDPSALTAGTYQGLITVTDTNTRATNRVPVTLSVLSNRPRLVLNQGAVNFVLQEGSGARSETVPVFSGGARTATFQVPTNPAPWLTISPAGGTAGATPLTVTANPAGLAAGVYQALVPLTSSEAANSPQVFTVTLQVTAATAAARPGLSAQALLFRARRDGPSQSQTLRVLNEGGGSLPFQAAAAATPAAPWLSVTPPSGTAGAASADLQVSVNPAGLDDDRVYRGKITVTAGGQTLETEVSLIVSSSLALQNQSTPVRSLAACIPQSLELLATTLGNGTLIAVSYPKVVMALAVDNCGTSIADATVTARLGDSTVPLQPVSAGLYSGLWTPRSAAASVPVVVTALHSLFPSGARKTFNVSTVSTSGSAELPVAFENGVVDGAAFTPRRPLPPGGIISIFGERLGAGVSQSSRIPLDRELGGVTVRIGAYSAPLFFVSAGQINAQVPYEVAGQEGVPVSITVNGRLTAPQVYFIAPAQPAIFMSGANAAVLDGQSRLVTPQNPARIGDTLQIFVAGLGATDPAVESGATLNTVSSVRVPVSVTIGGQPATIAYQGLAPGFVGLYQVNAVVAAGVAPGDAVPIVVRQNGVASNPEQTITVPVRPR